MSELKKEFKKFMEDLDKNVKNKEDLAYVKDRTAGFMNIVIEQMEEMLKYKEDKMSKIEKMQSNIEEKVNAIQQNIAEMEEEMFAVDEELFYDDWEDMEELLELNNYDLEIVCPYCDNEFLIDLSQGKKEVKCPECDNIIELDWSGDFDDNDEPICEGGNCADCHGCEPLNFDFDDDEEDDL